MERLHQIPVQSEVLFREGNFPLIDPWVRNAQEIYPIRENINALLDTGNRRGLEEFGFPADVIPVMQLWRQNGPDILTSFSHPEEMDLYKAIAVFNLAVFLERSRNLGMEFPSVLVNYYDTIPFHKSVLKPFQIGTYGKKLTADMFGIQGKRSHSLLRMPTAVPLQEVEETAARFLSSQEEIVSYFMEVIRPAIVGEMTQRGENIARQKSPHIRVIRKGLEGRLQQMVEHLNEVVGESTNPVNMSKLLMDFERRLIGDIFGSFLDTRPIEDTFGFACRLFSDITGFLNLVRESLRLLIAARGPKCVTSLVNPWEPLGTVSSPDGERRFLTKTEEDSLAVIDDCGFAMPVGKSELDEILSSLVPLGKLESLAIIVGGQTFHMGSEHGIREKVIAIVGTKGRAQEYSKKLRIGEDKEQGNEGVVLNLKQQGKIVAQVYVPLTTLFLLLGENGVKEVGAQLVGQTNKPIALNDEELLAFFGKQLLDDALDAKSDMSFFAEEKRYGIYS